MKPIWALNVAAQLLLLVQKVSYDKLDQFCDNCHFNVPILNKRIENIVEINDVSASWDENASRKTLERINLKIKPGQLYAFIGPVGAGKVLIKFQ